MKPDRQVAMRLRRAIARWPGGGQKQFAEAMKRYAERNEIHVPTTYRTLVNYVNGKTRPSPVWVEAAADLLGWRAEYLLCGEGPEREDAGAAGFGMTVGGSGERGARASNLVHQIFRGYPDLPMNARHMVLRFVDDCFGDDLEGWDVSRVGARADDVRQVVREYFGPLLTSPAMDEFETMAFTASLTAAAYVRLANATHQREGHHHA